MRALREAMLRLEPQPEFVLVDQYETPDLGLPQRAIDVGDDLSANIAAASTVAKVECDRNMTAYAEKYPE